MKYSVNGSSSSQSIIISQAPIPTGRSEVGQVMLAQVEGAMFKDEPEFRRLKPLKMGCKLAWPLPQGRHYLYYIRPPHICPLLWREIIHKCSRKDDLERKNSCPISQDVQIHENHGERTPTPSWIFKKRK